MKVALYARYSSDSQRDASIADQLRVCRAHAERQGWHIVEEYTDHAISGASLLRPGIQAMIADAVSGRFQVVLAEAMDRLSRDQEDIAGLFKRMSYGDVKIVTLSEGEVTQLHVGLKGTMNALFLKDLADKTRRGLRGRVEQGKSGGGNSYGYTVVKQFDAHGEAVRGGRAIDADQAGIIQRIFRDYATGKSAKKIAIELNRDRITAPSGGEWGFSTICGNPKRGTGILNNELYVGKLIWNRQRFVKDPASGKRQARLNPRDEWITQHVPELRIIADDLWSAVKEKQRKLQFDRDTNRTANGPAARRSAPAALPLVRPDPLWLLRRRLFDDLRSCTRLLNGAEQGDLRQPRDDPKGSVGNSASSTRSVIILMEPALFAEFCEEFTREMNRVRLRRPPVDRGCASRSEED